MRFFRGMCLSVLVVSLSVLSSRAAEPGDMPKLIELDSKEISAYVVVPHLDTFIKDMEGLGNKFSPFPMKPGTMKTQIGAGIGDPELAGFDFSKPLVIMVLKGPPALPPLPAAPPPVIVFIPVKNAEPYKNAMTLIMKAQVDVKDNVVISSDTPESLEKGVAQKAAYDKIAAAELKGDMRVFASIEKLTETYGRQIDGALDQASKTFAMLQANPAAAPGVDMKSLGLIMKVYMKAIAAALKQSQSVQMDLTVKDDSVAQDLLFAAKPASTLAKLMVEPSPGENAFLPLIKPGGILSIAGRFNPAAMKDVADALMPEIEKDPELKEVLDEKMTGMIKDAVPLLGGEMAMSMLPSDKGFAQTRSVMTITDAKKYTDLLDRMVTLIGPDSTLGKLYANMGITMQFAKNTREHAGVSIHAMKFVLDEKKIQPAQVAQMKLMMHDTELAVFKNVYLTSTVPAELDAMIDQVQSGAIPKADAPPLKAMATFGPKQQLYADYDLLSVMKATIGADPVNPMAALFKDMKGGEPIQIAGAMKDGSVVLHTVVPLEPIIQMAKTVQQLNGPGIKPPPPPPDKPGQF